MVKGLRFTKLFRFSNSSADSVTQCTGNQAGGADRNPGVDAVLEGDFFALRIEGRGYLRQELKAVREFDVFKFPGPVKGRCCRECPLDIILCGLAHRLPGFASIWVGKVAAVFLELQPCAIDKGALLDEVGGNISQLG
ncbi:hypothetical protein AAHB34_12540 [Paenarthrobacter ureafaciens]